MGILWEFPKNILTFLGDFILIKEYDILGSHYFGTLPHVAISKHYRIWCKR